MPRRSARDDSTDQPQQPSQSGASPQPLNQRQQRFVAEYLTDFNATQAAIRAGYNARTARSQGDRLLTNVDIAAAISGLDVLEEFETRGGDRAPVGVVKKYRIADKNSALDRAAKLLALFDDHNKQLTDPLVNLLKGLKPAAMPVTGKPDDD